MPTYHVHPAKIINLMIADCGQYQAEQDHPPPPFVSNFNN